MSFTFPSAKTHLRLQWSGDCNTQWESLRRRVSEHHFNHAVEILWPNVAPFPAELEDLVLPYHTAHLPLSRFLKPALIQQYASLAALSIDDRIDTGNVYALLPPGKLVMSIDKDTSEVLGLDSRPSQFDKHRRVVEVDLLAEHLSEGKRSRERLQWCLTERLDLNMDCVLCCCPSEEANLCSDFGAVRHLCQKVTRVLDGLPVPVLRPANPTGSLESGEKVCSGAAEVCSWMGTLSCNIERYQDEVDSYISSCTLPYPAVVCPKVIRSQWRGMVHTDHIHWMLKSMRDHITGDSWAALSVWGFEDSPVSWRTSEHGYCVSGHNNYVVVLFGSGQYWFVPAMGTYDIIP